MKSSIIVLILHLLKNCQCACSRGNASDDTRMETSRNLAPQAYYYETTVTGDTNLDVTLGNPMRGLVGNVENSDPVTWSESIPASLHMARLPLDLVMVGDPDVIGAHVAFNWTVLDNLLSRAQQFRSHLIVRFFLHWPGQPLHIPQYLLQQPYNIQTLWNGHEVVPWYGDRKLRRAIEQFIDHFGRRYDGDTRLFAIQAGLIGYWGEWHTLDCSFDWKPCDPEFVHEEVVSWFRKYFRRTFIEVRYPKRVDAFKAGMGYYDDSFTSESVSGAANGGYQHSHFFWNMSTLYETNNSWKRAPNGGEVRPENDNVFEITYPAGTRWHQDFLLCVKTCHTSYMGWSRGFRYAGARISKNEIKNARFAHARMGYNFKLEKVAVAPSLQWGKVDIDVTMKQIGNAPFYYPLYLDVYCDGIKFSDRWIGTGLNNAGDEVVLSSYGIPASASCLSAVEFVLDSYHLYPDRRIKWAQGNGRVVVNLPLPPGMPESKASPVPPPSPLPTPFYPPDSNSVVARCFIVCATNYCDGGRKSGDDLRGLSNGDKFSVSSVGKKLSIRCDMKEWTIDWVVFLWPGLHHSEDTAPFAMGGNIGNSFISVDYLSYPGRKTVTVQASSKGRFFGERVIDFDILP
jgi:hypothetical protein